MNVDGHAIALGAPNSSTDNNQHVLGHKIPHTAFLLLVLLAGVGLDVESQGIGGGDEQQQAADALQK